MTFLTRFDFENCDVIEFPNEFYENGKIDGHT